MIHAGLGVLLVVMMMGMNATAQNPYLNETFDTNPNLSLWTVDRYAPAAFVSDNSLGSNVLKIGIDASDGAQLRPSGFSGAFYNTQGRAFDQTGLNVKVLKGSLYLPSDWATKHRRSDMWAVGVGETNAVSSFPIMGFRNVDGASPTFSYWDDGSGWINFATPSTYDVWYNFEIRIVGTNVEYYLNNTLVGTISSYGSVSIGNVIMQAYNFNDNTLGANYDGNSSTNSYGAYWDNVITKSTVYNVTQATYSPTIQAAIDGSNDGDVINVGPGNYFESASNRYVLGTNGPHKFGLFIDKNNLTIRGVDANNNLITSASNAVAVITTNATNNFGYSGIFVQGNNVSLKGLLIKDNYDDGSNFANDKTIEIIGNGFNMQYCKLSTNNAGGGDALYVYFGEWSDDRFNAGTMQTYNISNCYFDNSAISVNNGVGVQGLVSGRTITNNTFDGTSPFYDIAFRGWNGASPVQGWIVYPVGGATITGNTFSNEPTNLILARGNA